MVYCSDDDDDDADGIFASPQHEGRENDISQKKKIVREGRHILSGQDQPTMLLSNPICAALRTRLTQQTAEKRDHKRRPRLTECPFPPNKFMFSNMLL